MRAHAGAESSYSVVEDGDPVPRHGKKGKCCPCELRELHVACVLGFPCKVKKFDSNRPFLAVIETA